LAAAQVLDEKTLASVTICGACKLHTRREHLETLKVVSIDGTVIPSYEFQETIGYSGKHRRIGVKISSVVDALGVPLSLVFAAGRTND
jgi:hypothetical protein